MTENQYILGLQTWAILTFVAAKQQSISYAELGKGLGYYGQSVQATAYPLGTVQRFCREKRLPKLTGIVGAPRTYWPGEHFEGSKTVQGLSNVRKNVFGFEWHLHHEEFCTWVYNEWQGGNG